MIALFYVSFPPQRLIINHTPTPASHSHFQFQLHKTTSHPASLPIFLLIIIPLIPVVALTLLRLFTYSISLSMSIYQRFTSSFPSHSSRGNSDFTSLINPSYLSLQHHFQLFIIFFFPIITLRSCTSYYHE